MAFPRFFTMIFRRSILSLALFGWLVVSAQGADVFNLGGVRDTATGTWTGLASVEFVPVGDAGNAADPDTGYGNVGYAFNMGKYDVTAGQYCTFLNAVAAKSDPYGLYNVYMDATQGYQGCNIKRNGTAGNYTYSVTSSWANRPVNYVSWGDAARFCNWLQNGQKTGNEDASTTEAGAYYLNGANTDEALMKVTRDPHANYFLPTLNEWYKAAYFDPSKLGAGQPGYWTYPTRHDNPPINVLDPNGTNNANFFDELGTGTGGLTIGGPLYRTEVGAFASSPSVYRTYDQGGNVSQWNETAVDLLSRGSEGGGFMSWYGSMARSTAGGTVPTQEEMGGCFRVASSVVPEPSILLMLYMIIMTVVFWRRSK